MIGLGRGLKQAKELGKLNFLLDSYKFIKKDYQRVARFVNLENLEKLASSQIKIKSETDPKVFQEIFLDIELAKEILEIDFSPKTDLEQEHFKLTSQILNNLKDLENQTKNQKLSDLIATARIYRKSLR